ncbi:hypothetical protein EDD36DRAFT_110095 [Exophiala viscosa]|uniref:Maltose/galactoside acetyltransferase domain-containing protein n=1 Tax=Exophiala viscosa TaxID=2486360 RepID=A0AAN6DLQ4_9EURO|nr:hypothetical protein EDD36DRAFT_110095 [Exophiala viscosa]
MMNPLAALWIPEVRSGMAEVARPPFFRSATSDTKNQKITNPEWEKAQRGELYHAFIPELIAARDLCKEATNRFNASTDLTRRRQVELWRAYEAHGYSCTYS